MFFKSRSIEAFQLLFAEGKRYVELQKKFIRLDITEKMAILLSALTLGAILLILGTIVILYLSVTLALFLGQLMGSNAAAFGIITLVLAIVFAVIYLMREKWIERPMTRFVGNLLLSESDAKETDKQADTDTDASAATASKTSKTTEP